LSLLEKGSGILRGKVLWFLVLSGLWISPPLVNADPERGRLLFKEKHCVLCHKTHLPGTVFKPICPGLKGVGERHSREWLRKWLADPAAVWATHDADVQDILDRYFEYRGTKPKPRESFMATVIGKRVKLTDEEIEALIDYLLTL
jgi:cytochrome c2